MGPRDMGRFGEIWRDMGSPPARHLRGRALLERRDERAERQQHLMRHMEDRATRHFCEVEPRRSPTPTVPAASYPTPTVPESRRGVPTVADRPRGPNSDYHWPPLDPGGATPGERLIWGWSLGPISGRSRPDLARRLVVLRLEQQRVGHQYEHPAEGAALSQQGAVALGEQLVGAAAAEQLVRLRGRAEERSRKGRRRGRGR